MASSPEEELGPLPIRDGSALRQNVSIDALRNALPKSDFLFRDERIDDAGVDGSVELVIQDVFTNLRSQVQLKSMETTKPNQDGSVSISVATTNLNYLLNGPSPLYVLYLADRDELRFAWAYDVYQELAAAGTDWKSQKTVTIHFRNTLTEAELPELTNRIRSEQRFQRKVMEAVASAVATRPLTIQVDPETLKVTDPSELFRLLADDGLAMVANGLAEEVLTAADSLERDVRLDPHVALTLAYANYALGHFHDAAARLGDASLRLAELSDEAQAVHAYLSDALDFQMGRITKEEYAARQRKGAEQLNSAIAVTRRLNELRYGLIGEKDPANRRVILEELQAMTAAVMQDARLPRGVQIRLELETLYSKVSDNIQSLLQEAGVLRTAEKLGLMADYSAFTALLDEGDELLSDVRSLAEEALTLNQPLLSAEAVLMRGLVQFVRTANLCVNGLKDGEPVALPGDAVAVIEADARWALNSFQRAGSRDGEIRAGVLLSDLLELRRETRKHVQ